MEETVKMSRSVAHLGAAAPFAFAVCLAARPAMAQDTSTLANQTVTIVVGTTTGGSTDMAARLMAPYLEKYLAGTPKVVVRNRPGAAGMTAFNIFAQQAAPDGKTAIIGSGYQIDPINYRTPQSKYDPTTFAIVGSMSMGGTALIIRNESLSRLTDRSQPPLAMASVPGIPRAGMQMTAWGIEYLGWNVKWVPGYTGNPDLKLAIQRGEADLTSFATTQLTPELLDRSKYTIMFQSGANGGTESSKLRALADVPRLSEALKDKITDPVAKQAFAYWALNSSINNWMALPPRTPAATAELHRAAFQKMTRDAKFVEQAKKLGEDVSLYGHEDMARIIHTLATIPPEALGHMKTLLAKQGLKLDQPKKKKKQ